MYRRIHYLLGIFTLFIFLPALVALQSPPELGNTLPDVSFVSIEGTKASFRPLKGKVLLISFWTCGQAKTDDLAKDALVLFKRLESKGLEMLSVCLDISKYDALDFGAAWHIPWLMMMNSDLGENRPTKLFGIEKTPCNLLVDKEGKVLALNLYGDEAHSKVAEVLGVSLDEIEKPMTPIKKGFASIQNRKTETSAAENDVSRKFLYDRLGTPKEREDMEEIKKKFRRISIALTRFKKDHDGQLPQWLSDLYPAYLQDESLLRETSGMGPSEFFIPVCAPKMTCDFLYEFNPGILFESLTMRQRKTEQLVEYGDKVPVVRYISNYTRSLNLSYGGEIYFSGQIWEGEYFRGHTLDDPDAKTRKNLLEIACALDKYWKEKQKDPYRLEDLFPNFLSDYSLLLCPATNEPFEYQLSNEQASPMATKREYHYALRKIYGEYVPIVRASGVLDNDHVINLGWTGEIWESRSDWVNDLQKSGGTRLVVESFDASRILTQWTPSQTYSLGLRMILRKEDPPGLTITAVDPESPALQAGLKPGDVITALDRRKIGIGADLKNLNDVMAFIQQKKDSETIFTFRMDGENESKETTVKPALMTWIDGKMVSVIPKDLESNISENKSWSTQCLKGLELIQTPEQVMALSGNAWEMEAGTIRQTDSGVQQSILLFAPIIEKGEMRLRARSNGYLGFHIVFGFSSPDSYYVWDICGSNIHRISCKYCKGLKPKTYYSVSMGNTILNFDLQFGKWYDIWFVLDSSRNLAEGYINGNKEWSLNVQQPLKGHFGVGTYNSYVEYADIEIKGY
ncbi:MAG: PDZ domain-containing protein [Candidatus Omnitrophota bacterium]